MTQTETITQCYHCQDACTPGLIVADNKDFCCDGCRMVYEILNTNQLCTYYQLDKNAGISQKKARDARSFAYLDDEEVQDKLIEYRAGDLCQTTFYLPNLHCVSCVWLLENLYKLDKGVHNTRVNFLKKTAAVQWDNKQTSLRKVAALLSSIGYAPEINLGDIDGKKPPLIQRRLAYQLAVAGFATGNIMLFSFPEYVGMDLKAEPWFAKAFGYLSIMLATPVLLYSAKDYFISAWEGLKQRHLNIDIPLVVAFLVVFGRSLYEIFTQTGGGYLDSFSGLVFLLLIGKWFQQKTWHQLSFERDYKSYFPVAAIVKKGNEEESVPVHRLVPGDIIVVKNEEIIPADGILLKGRAHVDYSFVTGESELVTVPSGERIFAGGRQSGERIEVTLTRRTSQSYLTKLWNDSAFQTQQVGEVTKLGDQAARFFTWFVLALGAVALGYWWGYRGMPGVAINAFTAVMIVVCPCVIALAIPFALGNIQRILGRHGFYVKNTAVLELFSDINAVVFDKTGTLTHGDQEEINYTGENLTAWERSAVRSLTAHSSHPVSRRIFALLDGAPVVTVSDFREIPGFGIEGRINGIHIKIGAAAFVETKGKGTWVAFDNRVKGAFDIKGRLRMGLAAVMNYFRGINPGKTSTWLLSGDQPREAALMQSLFPEPGQMMFEQTPQQKLDFVKKSQSEGHKVLMLGDGLNDAGALQQSNIGIVVSENINNFTPACDAILDAQRFDQLPAFFQLSKKGSTIVKRAYLVALLYNIVGISFSLTGNMSPLIAAILMPASSISVVLFVIFYGNIEAKRLGLSS